MAKQAQRQCHYVERVTKIHADLVEGYRRDYNKYAGKVDATLIESVFNSIPAQLSYVAENVVQQVKPLS
jgi:hypothetical protein